MGSLVGIDFGIKRTGLSCTDPLKIIASGLKNLATREVIPFLKKYCEMEEVDTFVVGKPLQKDGSQALVEVDIKNFIKKLQNQFPSQSIERHDERYTSKIAFQSMIEGGLKKKQRANKGMIDQVSATIILQSYLDFKTNTL